MLRYGLLYRHNIGTNRWAVVYSSFVTSGWDLDLRPMEWLVKCDIESDIAFLRRCPDVCVTPELQDKRWRTQSSRGCTPQSFAQLLRQDRQYRALGTYFSLFRTLPCHSREDPHLDHGYAMPSHSSQGQTADRVLIHVDTELSAKCPLNSRMAYVACRVHATTGSSSQRPRNAQHSPRKRCSH